MWFRGLTGFRRAARGFAWRAGVCAGLGGRQFSRCACGFTPAFGRAVGVCDAGWFMARLKPCPFESFARAWGVGVVGHGEGVAGAEGFGYGLVGRLGGSGRAGHTNGLGTSAGDRGFRYTHS